MVPLKTFKGVITNLTDQKVTEIAEVSKGKHLEVIIDGLSAENLRTLIAGLSVDKGTEVVKILMKCGSSTIKYSVKKAKKKRRHRRRKAKADPEPDPTDCKISKTCGVVTEMYAP